MCTATGAWGKCTEGRQPLGASNVHDARHAHQQEAQYCCGAMVHSRESCTRSRTVCAVRPRGRCSLGDRLLELLQSGCAGHVAPPGSVDARSLPRPSTAGRAAQTGPCRPPGMNTCAGTSDGTHGVNGCAVCVRETHRHVGDSVTVMQRRTEEQAMAANALLYHQSSPLRSRPPRAHQT